MEREESKRMIVSPEIWPLWPFLPVKRYIREKLAECGILIDRNKLGDPINPNHESLSTVLMVPIFLIKKKGKLEDSKKVKYESVDKMLDDGWMVD